MSSLKVISKTDETYFRLIRKNVSAFIKECAKKYDKKGLLLDIAPQIHEGAKPYFKKAQILTLDINPSNSLTYVADICNNNASIISNDYFDFVVCTEVLEHVLNPFSAVAEIYRILKPGGLCFISTPFNFRIHGPLPDCWRFTEHGLRELLKKYKILKLNFIESPGRWLMPVHYTVVAKKII
jgi:SAM-dependent methyltransferase